MPTPAVSLRLKRFRSRFGIAAPRVVVRTALPGYWFAAGAAAFLFFLLLVLWYFHAGGFGESEKLAQLRERLNSQQAELVVLRSVAGTGQSAVSMERAAQKQLVARIAELEAENAALKEDMLIFERLIPVVGQESVVRIESLRIVPVTASQYRYRLLIAYQAAQRASVFQGRYEISVAFKDPQGNVQRLPLSGGLEIRHFLRREGGFDLPSGCTLLSVEARLLQNTKVVAEQKIDF